MHILTSDVFRRVESQIEHSLIKLYILAEQPLLDQIIELLTAEIAAKLIHQLQKIKVMLADLAERYQIKFYKKVNVR